MTSDRAPVLDLVAGLDRLPIWLERLVARVGLASVLGIVALLVPVLFVTGSTLVGQPSIPESSRSSAAHLDRAVPAVMPLLAVPGLIALGLLHQVRRVPTWIRGGSLVLPFVGGSVGGSLYVGAFGSGLRPEIALLVAIPASFALAPAIPLLFPSDERSYGRLALGGIELFVAAAALVLVVITLSSVFVGALLSIMLAVWAGFGAATLIGEGLGYRVEGVVEFRERVRAVRTRIEDGYTGGHIGAEQRSQWQNRLSEIGSQFEETSKQQVRTGRLTRHARIMAVTGIVAGFVGGLIAATAFQIGPLPDASHVPVVRFTLGWGANLLVSLGLTLLLASGLAALLSHRESAEQETKVGDVSETLQDLREEVLVAIREANRPE